MSLSDTIADMLTRIRNAVRNQSPRVDCLGSNVCTGIAGALKREGYIQDYARIDDNRQGILRIELKYGPKGENLINAINRVSKPSRRIYSAVSDIPRPLDGLGITVVSTSKGVLSDREARTQHVGGELLCTVM